MTNNNHRKRVIPENWGFDADKQGQMSINGITCQALAETYGTPLHVVHNDRLAATAQNFLSSFREVYPGDVSVHYAFKCNPVPGIINTLKQNGLNAEVMSGFELYLAGKIGFSGEEIIVNGPFKTESLLRSCLKQKVRFIVADSIEELTALDKFSAEAGAVTKVLLRVNPNYSPKGMNKGTATGSRKGCSLGLDLEGGEADRALGLFSQLKNLIFKGFHFHIGSGIRFPKDYRNALEKIRRLIDKAIAFGLEVSVMDVGGGYASAGSREMNTKEMLIYQALDRLPSKGKLNDRISFRDYAEKITEGIVSIFRGKSLPELITEPGRCITGPNQILLLTVHQVKERPGIQKWITTDGGIGTVTMPTFYEFHEVFLCNDIFRPLVQRATVNGPGCFAADVVYRNKMMPAVKAGEVIAVMDSGAYFTSWESNFSYPRPAIVSVNGDKCICLRDRETFDEMLSRDHLERVEFILRK